MIFARTHSTAFRPLEHHLSSGPLWLLAQSTHFGDANFALEHRANALDLLRLTPCRQNRCFNAASTRSTPAPAILKSP
jgi:hypothetical protein